MSGIKKVLSEFRSFAVRGNVIDLAVGIIIGAAFSKIVDSLVRDLVMPIVNFVLGGSADFSNKFFILSKPTDYAGPETYAELSKAGAIVFAWGNFLTILINFILLAFVVFWMVKIVTRAREHFEEEKATAAPPAPPADVALLTEIRDLLKQNSRSAD
jgi:large conductance mechanosensitive channel